MFFVERIISDMVTWPTEGTGVPAPFRAQDSLAGPARVLFADSSGWGLPVGSWRAMAEPIALTD